MYVHLVSQPPELDAATKARIEAEELYRAQLRSGAAPAPAVPPAPSVPAPPAKKKAGCGTWVVGGIAVLVILGALGNLLPKSPDAVTSSTPPASDSTTSDTPTASTPPEPQTIAGGARMNGDGSQDVGVWNISGVRWNTTRSVGGDYGTRADAGETFVTVQFTLKNTTKETQDYSSLIDQPKLVLNDGSLIDADTMLSAEAGSQMIDGQIAPGLKRTGLYAFRVPSNQTSGMKFQQQFIGGDYSEWALSQ